MQYFNLALLDCPVLIVIHLLCGYCCCRYLEVEWEVRKGSQRSFGKEVMKGSSPRVPQQDNFSDCGVYVLQYVESFFEVSEQAGTLPSSAQQPPINPFIIIFVNVFYLFNRNVLLPH